MNLENYLIYDGLHHHAIQLREMQKDQETAKEFKAIINEGINDTQKIYKFPNGYGASIIKGSLVLYDMYELIPIKFINESDEFEFIDEYERYSNHEKEEMEKKLISIFKK